MSMFENEGYKWRETYFVFFDETRRPTLKQMLKTLSMANRRFEFENPTEDDQGGFESLTLRAPQDHAALDISYVSGEEVCEQRADLAKELRSAATEPDERAKLARLLKCDGRLDILHFEQIEAGLGGEEEEEMLDPSALLVVLDALVELTDGVGVDPQSGTIV